MSGHHGAGHPSPSSRRSSQESCDYQRDVSSRIIGSEPSSISSATVEENDVPSFECNQYFNKESAKVNAGFDMGAQSQDQLKEFDPFNVAHAFASGAPVVNIDFSQFVLPIVAPGPPPTAAQLVCHLLNPPPHAFLHGVLSLQWAIGAGNRLRHFRFRNSDERYILKEDSDIRIHGAALGLPTLYLEWLCGNDESVSAAEQCMYFTPQYFEDLQRNY
ncbi:hypothetical protein NX059_007585 [Plenodomus lindquistii]|nr:hypothetical protein NX059_007585 [Plenodomus lindquistii]